MPDVILPTLHPGQVEVFNNRARFNAIRIGRRWGKTKFVVAIAGSRAAKGGRAGVAAPEHRQLVEVYDELEEILSPIKRRFNKTEGKIITTTGGMIDFFHLDDNPLAGRGKEFDDLLIDEAGFLKKRTSIDTWRKSLRPTLITRRGRAWVAGTPSGIDEEDFFWNICNDPDFGFKEHHAPSNTSPYVPFDEFERERLTNHPLVFQQEFLAEFVSWSGVAFFEIDKLLENGQPVEYPAHCDAVFAIMDTAVKTGSANDGTGVIYFARSKFTGHPLVILDYDYFQIEGASLEFEMPNVFRRLEELAKLCKARNGSIGALIEDAASGSLLLQQAVRNQWPAQAIDSVLTAKGKDERAINASPFVYRGMVKISRYAFDKVTTFKGITRNHMMSQILGFRVGDKDAAKRADDLLDCLTYGVALSLGGGEGI